MNIIGDSPKTKNEPRRNGNWFRTTERKDPNAMDVDAMTFEERQTLMRQGKCFRCKKPGHLARDCPGENQKKKDYDPVKSAYATIRALSKDQKDAFAKMMLEGGAEEEDF
jgi:hypothetical protein